MVKEMKEKYTREFLIKKVSERIPTLEKDRQDRMLKAFSWRNEGYSGEDYFVHEFIENGYMISFTDGSKVTIKFE